MLTQLYDNLLWSSPQSAQSGPGGAIGQSAYYNQNQSMSTAHSATMAAQQNQAANQLYQAQVGMLSGQLYAHQHTWMVNGKTMTFEQFLDEICPDPDDAMRTLLILKYRGVK